MLEAVTCPLQRLAVTVSQRLAQQLLRQLAESVLLLDGVALHAGLLCACRRPSPVLVPPRQSLQRVHLEMTAVG